MRNRAVKVRIGTTTHKINLKGSNMNVLLPYFLPSKKLEKYIQLNHSYVTDPYNPFEGSVAIPIDMKNGYVQYVFDSPNYTTPIEDRSTHVLTVREFLMFYRPLKKTKITDL